MFFAVVLFSFDAFASPEIHGSLSNRYRLRTTGGTDDHRMETIATLDIGLPQDKLSGSLQGGGLFRLNDRGADSNYSNVYDSFSGSAVGRLYYAYLNARDLGPLVNLRAGRQHRFEFESLYFDGVELQSDAWNGFQLTSFGGVPVHLFETQSGLDPGDWLAGAALDWDYFAKLQCRFDYVHLRDKKTGFRIAAGDEEDDLFGGSVWIDPDEHLHLFSRFTSFADQVRDLTVQTNLTLAEQNFSVRGHFFRLLKGYAIRVIDLDAYGVVGAYQPYTEFGLSATKGLGKYVTVDGGGALRFLDDEQVASPFNHGYNRAYLSLTSADLGVKGLSLSATGDYYQGIDATLKNNSFGGSFLASQALLKERLKVFAGTAYSLYRFNLFTGNESNDVQTYYAGAKGEIVRHLDGKLQYELEHNDTNDFHSVNAQLTWSF